MHISLYAKYSTKAQERKLSGILGFKLLLQKKSIITASGQVLFDQIHTLGKKKAHYNTLNPNPGFKMFKSKICFRNK
jgi:hypothetical protein